MSERERKQSDGGHPSGSEGSDNGTDPRMLEGSAQAFEEGRESTLPFDSGHEEAIEAPPTGDFEMVEKQQREHLSDVPGDEVRHPDPEFLEEHSIKSLDNVAGEPDPVTGEERAVLKPDRA